MPCSSMVATIFRSDDQIETAFDLVGSAGAKGTRYRRLRHRRRRQGHPLYDPGHRRAGGSRRTSAAQTDPVRRRIVARDGAVLPAPTPIARVLA